MPTYEYECRSCKRQFEKFQPITAKPNTSCPKCKATAKRLISAGGGLLFKGSGFYVTDYRSSGYKKQAAAESKPAPKSPAPSPAPSPASSPAGGCSSGKPGGCGK